MNSQAKDDTKENEEGEGEKNIQIRGWIILTFFFFSESPLWDSKQSLEAKSKLSF